MNKFLNAYDLLKLKPENTNNLRKSITSDKVEALIQSPPAK